MKLTFKNADGVDLVGILELPPNGTATQVVIFVHGLYQHKNITFLRSFGQRIPKDAALPNLATFRFDCRGLGESGGTTTYAPHHNNLADLRSAIAFLAEAHGLAPFCVFGYSAGGNVAVLLAAEAGGHVPFVVAASPRFHMAAIRNTITDEENAALRATGAFEYRFSKRGKPQVLKVTSADIKAFAAVDMAGAAGRIPAATHVLTAHGLTDVRVPPADAAGFVNNIKTVQQLLLPSCGHGYDEDESKELLYETWKAWILAKGAVRARL